MTMYRFVWKTGWPCHMTVNQYEAACQVAEQWKLPYNNVVHPVFGSKAVLINTGEMWIGVEEDGHTHS